MQTNTPLSHVYRTYLSKLLKVIINKFVHLIFLVNKSSSIHFVIINKSREGGPIFDLVVVDASLLLLL